MSRRWSMAGWLMAACWMAAAGGAWAQTILFPTPVTPYLYNPTNDNSQPAGKVIYTGYNGAFGIGTAQTGAGSTNTFSNNGSNAGVVNVSGSAVMVGTNQNTATVTNTIEKIITNLVACWQERCTIPLTSTNGWVPINLTNFNDMVLFTNNICNISGPVHSPQFSAIVTNTLGSNWAVTCKIRVNGAPCNGNGFGLVLCDAGANPLSTNAGWTIFFNGTFWGLISNVNEDFNGTHVLHSNGGPDFDNSQTIWLRLVDDGTNVTYYSSLNGIDHEEYITLNRTNLWGIGTTNPAAYVGVAWSIQCITAGSNSLDVLSWENSPCPGGQCY